ncbi:MAG: VTT domain-containing protein [Betaproteobacteria bacterium]
MSSLHTRRWPRLLLIALLALVPLSLAAGWKWTPLNHLLDIAALADVVDDVKDRRTALLWVIGGYLIGGVIAAPVTVLNIVTILVFGPIRGAAYALLSATLSGLLTYGMGHWFGRRIVERLGSGYVGRISERLGRSGILAVFIVRLLPIAPFTFVNMIAGASHIRLRDFALGTLFGLMPGILVIALFLDRLTAAVRAPGWASLASLGVLLVVIAVGVAAVRRWARKQAARTFTDAHSSSR